MTGDADYADPSGKSYVLDGANFVKDNVAVFPTGVAMKDATRTFVVHPETLVLGEVIGRGASSYVQRATHAPTGTQLALKVISVFDRSKRAQLIREIQALYDADCDCLVSFFGAFHREGAISIALEYCDLGPLPLAMRRAGGRPLPEPVVAALAYQVLWALAYLRVEKRLHRDVKPSNILLNSKGQVRACAALYAVLASQWHTSRSCAGKVDGFRPVSGAEKQHRHGSHVRWYEQCAFSSWVLVATRM